MLEQRVAQQRHQVAATACAAQLGAQQQQVGQRVLEKLLVAAAADVDLDGEPQVLQPARRAEQIVEARRHTLELDLVRVRVRVRVRARARGLGLGLG